MASIFDTIRGRAGSTTGHMKKSAQWYRTQVSKLASNITARQLMRQGKLTTRPSRGKLSLYAYDPKLKGTLPYYDVFPLVLPLDPIRGGFIGMNFHYLPPLLRFEMLDKMSRFATDRKFDKKKIFDLNYDDVKRIKIIKPTLKKYLWSHMRSDFLRVDLDEAAIAIMLPVARFKKASEAVVWSDSRNKIA